MMKFFGALVLMLTLSTACGLKCYECVDEACKVTECRAIENRCAVGETGGKIIKGCFPSSGCGSASECCETDLCNSAIPTGSSVLLLLVSSTITAVFL